MRGIKLKSSHWIVDKKNRIVMGEGRLLILDRIEETGSINQAAKSLGMSYKTAWSKIKSTETHLKVKLLDTDRNLGSRLTKKGKELLENYRKLKAACITADDEIFQNIFSKQPHGEP